MNSGANGLHLSHRCLSSEIRLRREAGKEQMMSDVSRCEQMSAASWRLCKVSKVADLNTTLWFLIRCCLFYSACENMLVTYRSPSHLGSCCPDRHGNTGFVCLWEKPRASDCKGLYRISKSASTVISLGRNQGRGRAVASVP